MKKTPIIISGLTLAFLLFLFINNPYLVNTAIQAKITNYDRNATSIKLAIKINNNSWKSIYVSSDFLDSCSLKVSGPKLIILDSDHLFGEGVCPYAIMTPEQTKVGPFQNITLYASADLNSWVDPDISTWLKYDIAAQGIELTFMYFTREITDDMVSAGYTKEFNALIKKYGKRITAKWNSAIH